MPSAMLDEDIAHFSRLTVPYISIDHDFTTQNISTVAINNQMGTFQAIEYLVNMGHTDIGYVHTTEYISSWSERALGYRQALAQFRLPLSDDKVYRARYNGGNSYDDFCQVITSGAQLPTALVTDDDVIAVGVMRALAVKRRITTTLVERQSVCRIP